MAREIQYSRISTKLQNLKAAHPQNVSMALWKETFKGLINGGEAMRFFDVFAGTLMLLKARNNRYLKWADTANSANWTAKWVENIFQKYDILSKFGPTTVDGKVLHPRKPKTIVVIEQPIEEAPVEEKPKEQVFDCSHFSDELLNVALEAIMNEIERRESIKRKKAQLETICQAAGITVDNLEELIKLYKE